ncbi:hypothetical protein E2562_014538 [Oryza meyeriana var. granulata]|uniref:Uncharacterized protein n=1 Tax=Oryza meyeriana var. granulata TaxID=110450 RepID=A0A6G1EI37_9ORYZ|nr:hypothetical protein E2562_014538 [Oryza meyeriana var. granulata]
MPLCSESAGVANAAVAQLSSSVAASAGGDRVARSCRQGGGRGSQTTVRKSSSEGGSRKRVIGEVGVD